MYGHPNCTNNYLRQPFPNQFGGPTPVPVSGPAYNQRIPYFPAPNACPSLPGRGQTHSNPHRHAQAPMSIVNGLSAMRSQSQSLPTTRGHGTGGGQGQPVMLPDLQHVLVPIATLNGMNGNGVNGMSNGQSNSCNPNRNVANLNGHIFNEQMVAQYASYNSTQLQRALASYPPWLQKEYMRRIVRQYEELYVVEDPKIHHWSAICPRDNGTGGILNTGGSSSSSSSPVTEHHAITPMDSNLDSKLKELKESPVHHNDDDQKEDSKELKELKHGDDGKKEKNDENLPPPSTHIHTLNHHSNTSCIGIISESASEHGAESIDLSPTPRLSPSAYTPHHWPEQTTSPQYHSIDRPKLEPRTTNLSAVSSAYFVSPSLKVTSPSSVNLAMGSTQPRSMLTCLDILENIPPEVLSPRQDTEEVNVNSNAVTPPSAVTPVAVGTGVTAVTGITGVTGVNELISVNAQNMTSPQNVQSTQDVDQNVQSNTNLERSHSHVTAVSSGSSASTNTDADDAWIDGSPTTTMSTESPQDTTKHEVYRNQMEESPQHHVHGMGSNANAELSCTQSPTSVMWSPKNGNQSTVASATSNTGISITNPSANSTTNVGFNSNTTTPSTTAHPQYSTSAHSTHSTGTQSTAFPFPVHGGNNVYGTANANGVTPSMCTNLNSKYMQSVPTHMQTQSMSMSQLQQQSYQYQQKMHYQQQQQQMLVHQQQVYQRRHAAMQQMYMQQHHQQHRQHQYQQQQQQQRQRYMYDVNGVNCSGSVSGVSGHGNWSNNQMTPSMNTTLNTPSNSKLLTDQHYAHRYSYNSKQHVPPRHRRYGNIESNNTVRII